MKYANLGRSGTKVSRLAVGCLNFGAKSWRSWMLEEDEARPLIKAALDAGINFFDTADSYSLGASEALLGRVLKHLGVPRSRVVIATKAYQPLDDDPNGRGLSRKHLRHAIDDSLRRLGADYVDLYQLHRYDASTPIEETLAALDDIVRAGKALHIGASTMGAWQLARLNSAAERLRVGPLVTMQSHYNLVYREDEREILPLCRAEGIGVLPWSPLARGFLAGTRLPGRAGLSARAQADAKAGRLYAESADLEVLDRLTTVAAARGANAAQVALAWLLHQPAVVAPLVGVSRKEHIEDAVRALDLALSAEEIGALESPYRPHALETPT